MPPHPQGFFFVEPHTKFKDADAIANAIGCAPLPERDTRYVHARAREVHLTDRVAQRNESEQLRDMALNLQSTENHPFLAPWWLSPEIAYWSNQPGVAGSSHESLLGIEDSARFFVSEDWGMARKLLENHKVAWVIAYDSQRTAQNSGQILGMAVPQQPVCMMLDKVATTAPPFLVLSAQNGVAKLYRVIAR